MSGTMDEENTHSFKNIRMMIATRRRTQADVMTIAFAGGKRENGSQ